MRIRASNKRPLALRELKAIWRVGDALNVPSVPSRLAAVSGCVLALALATPALADKQPGKTPPPPVAGLQPPGQSSGGSEGVASAAPQNQPAPPAPSGGGVAQPHFTPKLKKDKGGGQFASPHKQKNGGQASFTPKASKPKDSSPSITPATSSSTPSATPAGGSTSTPAPSAPATPGGGSEAPKRHKTHRAARHRGSRNHRSSGSTAPRSPLPAARPENVAPPAPAAPAPPKPAKDERPSRGLSSVRVSVVTRTVHDIVRVIPGPVKAVIGAMAVLLLAAIAAWTVVTLRARRLRRQRGQLLQEVGLLQAALLPEVPEQIGPVAASVAYRPADGPGAGGDFYDVFQLENGNVGLVLGDVAGHGRDALARTALLRYTLRAYLETGLEPRIALRLAGETLEHKLGGGFATAAVGLYDSEAGTLTYSCAGHPPPILLGPPSHDPVTACSAPPIGVGERTGVRQTTVELPVGSVACFFTDGLAEARVDGDLFGRERVAELIAELGPDSTASTLIERIRGEVHHMPDDMAACLLRPLPGSAPETASAGGRIEELELREGGERDLRRFLAACGIPPVEIGDLVRSADARFEDYGGAVVRVTAAPGEHPHVSIMLPIVELLGDGAARR
jgi:hypothetical protein